MQNHSVSILIYLKLLVNLQFQIPNYNQMENKDENRARSGLQVAGQSRDWAGLDALKYR